MSKHCIWLLAFFLLGCAPGVYQRPYPVQPVQLPRDDGAHRAPIEWWYYTGHLQTEDGDRFGFELTFFKAYTPPAARLAGVPVAWLLDKAYVAHFAVTDIDGQRFTMVQRADYWGFEAGATANDLAVFLGDWRAERLEGAAGHRLSASGGGYELELELQPLKPAALHGDPPGLQSMGPGGVSYYVSNTRLAVTGRLGTTCNWLGCRRRQVTGQAWFDHQWGDFDLSGFAGWDWFSLQLADGRELMLYLIRAPDGSHLVEEGSLIAEDGSVTALSEADFSLEPVGTTWTSSDTGAVYPLAWRLRVPAWELELAIEPLMQAQEMNTRATTGIVYWEGAVALTGSHEGLGYIELTNYDLYPFGLTDDETELVPLSGPFGSF